MLQLRRALMASSARLGGAIAATGASLLLVGETDGMASDFTVASGQGDVSVKDTSTPGNVVTNVIGDAFWGNAGTSPKLVTKSDGTLAWSPHNLIVQSETLGSWATQNTLSVSSNAAVAPDGTTTADKLISDNGSSTGYNLSAAITTINGATYAISIRAKVTEWSWIRLYSTDGSTALSAWFNLSAGTVGTDGYSNATITNLGNGWYLCTVYRTVASTSVTVRTYPTNADNTVSTGDGTSGIYAWGAQINRGTVPTAYHVTTTAAWFGLGIDYANGSYGLLVEPAATNLALRSQEFDNAAWTATRASATANATTAPDGTTTADFLKEDSTAGASHFIATTAFPSFTSGTTYTWSVYAKAGTRTFLRLQLPSTSFTTNVTADFDLVNGVVGTLGNSPTTSMIALGNGWYRCSISKAATVTDAAAAVIFALLSADNVVSYNGDNASGLYLWGAQLETGTVATSPIPTFAATVTRAADAPNKLVSALPWSATAGTIVISIYKREINTSQASDRLWATDDTTANNNFNLAAIVADNPDSYGFGMTTGNTSQVDGTVTKTGAVSLSGNKFGGAWAANDVAILASGGTEVADTSATIAIVTKLSLGSTPLTAVREMNGWIKAISYFPVRKTQAQMQAKMDAMP